jgi:NCS2 family nucleobase:cation symporter-2
MKRPPGLVYALEESPPPLVTALTSMQHVGLIAINLVYPLLIFRIAGIAPESAAHLIASGMAVLGIATFIQCRRIGPLGSGFMCPATVTATYFGPSVVAVKAGGLPLVFGMTVFAGLVEVALARLLHRLRSILPTELSGLVIFMIGISAGIAGVRTLVGAQAEPVTPAEWSVAFLTLSAMVASNVWGRGIARMLCAMLGVIAGYVASAFAGLFASAQIEAVAHAPLLAVPTLVAGEWSFDVTLAAVFATASVAAAMKAVGTIAVCQRMNDADWVRADMRSTARGVLADGAGAVVAGIVGAVGTNTSTPSVGLAAATGMASRYAGYAIAALFVALGFMPKLCALLAAMPRSVMVAALLFSVCFIIINGLQVMTSRLLDSRRTIVIGLAVIAGTAIEVFPQIAQLAPAVLKPITGSSLVFATVIALVLNLLFRIGVRKKAALPIGRDAVDSKKIEDFLRNQGALWGARPEIISRAVFGVNQLVEAVAENCWRTGEAGLEASFDEFQLVVRLAYEGDAMDFPLSRPTDREIIENDDGARRLAGFMLRHNADRIRTEVRGGRSAVVFQFDH